MMIAPVFKYRWQAVLFFPVLAFFMALPFMDKPSWMERGILYRTMEMASNNRNNILYKIITEPGDIDVLFLGSSTLASGVNPLIVRAALRAATGTEAKVYTVYHPQAGFDFDYIILRDILARRHVKLLIWDGLRPPRPDSPVYHHVTPYVWDYKMHEDLAKTMNSNPADVYLYSLMTGPKLLLSPVLSLGKQVPEEGTDFLCDKVYYLGACLRFNDSQLKMHYPPPPHLDMDRLLHFRGNDSVDLRDTKTYRDLDYQLLQKVLGLAKEHDVPVAFLIAPVNGESERAITVPGIPQDALGWNVPIIGATQANVINGTEIKVDDFFQEDRVHMMFNATNYYTEMLLPAIVNAYQQAVAGGIKVPPTVPEALMTLHQEAPNEVPPHDSPTDVMDHDLEKWLSTTVKEGAEKAEDKIEDELGLPDDERDGGADEEDDRDR